MTGGDAYATRIRPSSRFARSRQAARSALEAAGRVECGLSSDPSALDCLHLAPGRGFSSPGPLSTTTQGFLTWPAETFESLSPSHARSASIATTRRTRASATTPTASRCASTAAGAASTPATGRRASAGALPWPVTVNAQSSAASAAAAAAGLPRRRAPAPSSAALRADLSRRARPRLRRGRRVRRRARAWRRWRRGDARRRPPDDVRPRPRTSSQLERDRLSRGELRPPADDERQRGGGDGGGGPRAAVGRSPAGRQPRCRLPPRQLGRAAARAVARPPPGHPGDGRRARLRRDRRRLSWLRPTSCAKEIVEFIL